MQRQGDASTPPTLDEISGKLRKLYTEAKYISFDAEIVQHESLAPGFIIVPGRGVPPGTVFHVLMSSQGDVRADMTIGDELVYSFQISADCPDAASGTDDNCTYTIREYNHRDRIASVPRVENKPPTNLLLNDTFLSGPTSCASGGVLLSHIGKRGSVVEKSSPQDIPLLHKIVHGNVVGRRVVDGQSAAVVAFVQRAPSCDDAADVPEDSDYPGITWRHTVAEANGVVLRREVFLVPCTGDPVRFRSVHFRNVEFPEQIASSAVFSQPPTEWKAYSVWSDPEGPKRASAIGQSK